MLLLLVTGGVGVVGDDLDTAAIGVRILLVKQLFEAHEGQTLYGSFSMV